MYTRTLEVQFSGNKAIYSYGLTDLDGTPVVGQRVVVPTKLKDDGTVTLTIATVVSVHNIVGPSLKPIIALLPNSQIAWATSEVKRLEVLA
jgi:hypothetical protein